MWDLAPAVKIQQFQQLSNFTRLRAENVALCFVVVCSLAQDDMLHAVSAEFSGAAHLGRDLSMSYTKCLEQFVETGKKLLVLNGPSICIKRQRLLILDLSFNPPHLAHFALASEAFQHDFGDEYRKEILLLLSIKNADKSVSDILLFNHRLSMMRLMADQLESLNVNVSIGLTNCAKFADKAQCLGEYYPNSTLTFLLGFDTLIRVLDPKYYLPLTLAESLASFMARSELFCLTRAENAEKTELQQQYVENIAQGKYSGIPAGWSKRIFVASPLNSENHFGSISSTSIRNSYANGAQENLPVLASIKHYIETNRLYCKDSE